MELSRSCCLACCHSPSTTCPTTRRSSSRWLIKLDPPFSGFFKKLKIVNCRLVLRLINMLGIWIIHDFSMQIGKFCSTTNTANIWKSAFFAKCLEKWCFLRDCKKKKKIRIVLWKICENNSSVVLVLAKFLGIMNANDLEEDHLLFNFWTIWSCKKVNFYATVFVVCLEK
jgi:hypothetical protein